MSNTPSPAVEVTQADRDAATALGQLLGVPDITGPRNQDAIAKAFARHRLTPLPTRDAAIEEAAKVPLIVAREMACLGAREDVRAQFKCEMDALVRTAEASPYHTEGSRQTARAMRDAAIGAFDAARAALASSPTEQMQNGEEMPEVAAMRYIEELRREEGDSVRILCDDPEASTTDKRLAIECNGSWTDWQDRRFYGESVLQCLAKAVCARGGKA